MALLYTSLYSCRRGLYYCWVVDIMMKLLPNFLSLKHNFETFILSYKVDLCLVSCILFLQVGSRQYIVFPGRFIYTQRLKGANVNDKVSLSDEKLKNLNLICSLSYLCLPSVYVIILVSSFTCVLLVFQVSFYLMFGQYSSGWSSNLRP